MRRISTGRTCLEWLLPSQGHSGYRKRARSRSYVGPQQSREYGIPTFQWTKSRVQQHVAFLSLASAIVSLPYLLDPTRRQFASLRHRSEASKEFTEGAGWSPPVRLHSSRDQSGQLESENSARHPQSGPIGPQKPPPQARVVKDGEVQGHGVTKESSGWIPFTATLSNVEWLSIPDRIKDFIVPDWVKILPGFMAKLQRELSMAPGSLAEEIWEEANDPEVNPEIMWDCSVRVSDDLCDEEKAFLSRRKRHVTRAMSRYLNVPEDSIHPDDVPVISMCGSGGGLRALVAGSSSYLCTKEAGLFDCVTYTAGVSGSCWLQTLFYSSITQQSHSELIHHLKNRLGVHIAYPPAALALTTYAPTNKFLLSGLVEKLRGVPDADFGIVDIYGLLLAARLLVPKGELGVNDEDLKISNQRQHLAHGQFPLPIYTAVRHEIPVEEQKNKSPEEVQAQARREAWFQWFEFTPYEFWCEELQAGIPTWAIGRKFESGRSMWRSNGLALPELRVPLLMGIWGSAFCATLSHYYKEVRPIMKGLAGFAGVDSMIAERDEDLVKVHMIDPAAIPNFAVGMQDQLPSSCPQSIFQAQHLQLMDAGMSNNLPIYPLLRPGREVDVIIAFDSSADVKQDNWLRVCDGYARQRGIKGWPVGAGWPPSGKAPSAAASDLEEAEAKSPSDAKNKVDKVQSEDYTSHADGPDGEKTLDDLGYCNVWVGTTEERTSDGAQPKSKLVEDDWELMKADAGITVVYFPFLPNEKVDGIDPTTTDFLSTWNFVYTPEQVEKVVELARANFKEGERQVKATIRAVYERKKKSRLEREVEEKDRLRRWKLRRGLGDKRLGEGDHADQFR